jgi:hypothetical protein
MCEGQEGHEGGSKDTDYVTDSHHEQTGILPSSSDDTGDKEGDDLKGSSGTVEESSIDRGETQSFDD